MNEENTDKQPNRAATQGRTASTCSVCCYWREKWLSTRRHLRAANKGAENNALALQLQTKRRVEQDDRIVELRVERQRLRDAIRKIGKLSHTKDQNSLWSAIEEAERLLPNSSNSENSNYQRIAKLPPIHPTQPTPSCSTSEKK